MKSEIAELVIKIKEKKELAGISNIFIEEALIKYFAKSKLKDYSKLSEKEEKIIIKDLRNELRKYAGRFQKDSSKRKDLLKNNKIEELLFSHSSTKERIESYQVLKEEIKKLNTKSILDLGCGLNPIALAEPGIEYFACDIREDELELINGYFKSHNISGKVFFYDLRKIDNNLPSVDLCLILKVVDVIERRDHKLSEKIIKSINSKNIIISFSTKTLSNKPMNHPQRGWIERLLSRLNYPFRILKTKNEIFYIVSKSN